MTGIPLRKMEGEETTRLLNMEAALHKRVISQHEAVQTVAKAVRRTVMSRPKRSKTSGGCAIGPSR